MRLIKLIKLTRIIKIIIKLLYNHFHHFIDINDSDYSFHWAKGFHWLFAVVPYEPLLHEQQPLSDLSWFVVDEPTLMTAAPRRATI